jgi:hypothetical protein
VASRRRSRVFAFVPIKDIGVTAGKTRMAIKRSGKDSGALWV